MLDVVALYADALMFTAIRKMFHVQTGLPISGLPVHDVKAIFDRGVDIPTSTSTLVSFISTSIIWRCPPRQPSPSLLPAIIQHMPTYLDVLAGDYRRSTDSNTAAVQADEKYLTKAGPKNLYSFYLLHNYHSLASAILAGQSRVALKTLDKMESTLTDDVLRVTTPSQAEWLEFFKVIRIHVYIRFGLWDEIKAFSLRPHLVQLGFSAIQVGSSKMGSSGSVPTFLVGKWTT